MTAIAFQTGDLSSVQRRNPVSTPLIPSYLAPGDTRKGPRTYENPLYFFSISRRTSTAPDTGA